MCINHINKDSHAPSFSRYNWRRNSKTKSHRNAEYSPAFQSVSITLETRLALEAKLPGGTRNAGRGIWSLYYDLASENLVV